MTIQLTDYGTYMSDLKHQGHIDEKEVIDNISEAERREISQNYKIISKQGAGGCSVVYDAWRISDGRHVAIKVLALPESLDEKEAAMTKKRFYREARILTSLQNDHSVHCYEYGVFNNAPCVVLEFVEGQQLDTFLREYGALPFDYAVNIINQVLEALEEAHSKGIIHHDIKPANIMVIQNSDPPVVRLIDFGIATLQEGALGEIMKTQLGVVRGTPSYMAPELFTGDVSATPESDLYAVGLVLLECITGSIPFAGASLVQIAFKQAHEPVVIPKLIPDCLGKIIRKCCDKVPDDRYHSALELREDLTKALPEAIEQRAACEAAYLQDIKNGNTTGVSLPPTDISALSAPNKSKTILILVGAIALIAAAAAVLVIVLNAGNSGSTNPGSSAAIEEMKAQAAQAEAEAEAAKAKAEAAKAEAAKAKAEAEAAKAQAEAEAAKAQAEAEAARAKAEAEAAKAQAEAEAARAQSENEKPKAAATKSKNTSSSKSKSGTASASTAKPTSSSNKGSTGKTKDTSTIPLNIF